MPGEQQVHMKFNRLFTLFTYLHIRFTYLHIDSHIKHIRMFLHSPLKKKEILTKRMLENGIFDQTLHICGIKTVMLAPTLGSLLIHYDTITTYNCVVEFRLGIIMCQMDYDPY